MMHKKKIMKKLSAAVLTAGLTAAAVLYVPAVSGTDTVLADEQVASVYTGELVSAAQASQRPIAVMVPTDKAAQPSYGIGNAKVLYEIMEEGEMSRQMAIIDDWQGLDRVGSIRSCRDYYITIAKEWDPILIHVGGVHYMADKITAPDVNNLSAAREYGTGGGAPGSSAFFRSTDRKVPHNAYVSGEGVTKACNDLGYSLATRPEYYNASHFQFAPEGNTLEQYDGAVPGNTIDLSDIFPYTRSSLTYNPETGLYAKNIHGQAQVDSLTGNQLTFANVIVQNTKWSKRDAKGYLAFQTVDSTCDGYYFTKGKGIHITWKKTSDYSPTRYYDDNGVEIQLNAGKTFIAVAQQGRTLLNS